MSESSPLAGLTEQEADEAIDRFAGKVEQQEENLKVAKAHLKEMKAARKDLVPPQPTGGGTVVYAEPATITAEAGEVG
ncbi:MAG TPA: hypothetical protein VGJ86_13555 [Acidimicrobiales bacterium]|jgi:hypothetical protein